MTGSSPPINTKMGVSSQHHQVVIGCFAASLGSSALLTAGNSSRDRKSRCSARHGFSPWRPPPCAKWWQALLFLVTVIVNTTFMVVIPPLLVSSAHSMVQTQTRQFSSCSSGWQSGHCWQEQEHSAQATWQVVIQLELAGDVESNPGPGPIRVTRSNLPGDDRLNEGKALIIHQAPAIIRLVLRKVRY